MISPVAPPTGLPPISTALPKGTGIDDQLLLYQLQQYRFMQTQQQNQMLLNKFRNTAIAKLSQNEQWPSLSPVEQNQLIMQYLRNYPESNEFIQLQPPIVPNTFMPTVSPSAPPSNAVLQLFPQFQVRFYYFLMIYLLSENVFDKLLFLIGASCKNTSRVNTSTSTSYKSSPATID